MGFLLVGCGEKGEVVDKEEKPWQELRGEWEWVSGGEVEDGEELRMGRGDELTGVRWGGDVPKVPFELEMEAKRVDGTDFFCAVTFPARGEDEFVTLVVGGWGGGLVGISSVDGMDASENETTTVRGFNNEVWYGIRIVCEEDRIQAWIDEEKVVDLVTRGKKLGLRSGPIEDCVPFGLATWQTTGVVRGVRWKKRS